MMISGFLKPNGTWERVAYSLHEEWAEQECLTEGWETNLSATDALRAHGYAHISDGQGWFVQRNMEMVKLTHKQLDWLLENIEGLTRGTRRTLVDQYGLVLPGVEATDYSVPLAEPYSTGG